MLYVHGKQIALDIVCQTEKHLFIDIEKGDLSELNSLDPTITYIITNRSLADFDEYIAKGFFNIAIVSSVGQITKRFIAEFIQQEYEDNQLKITATRLVDSYKTNKATVGDLQKALQALYDDDAQTFADIMSTGLPDILAALKDVDAMVAFSNSLSTTKTSMAKLMKDSKELETIKINCENYRAMYETEVHKSEALQSELKNTQDEITELKMRPTEVAVTNEQIVTSPVYLELQAKYAATDNELQASLAEINAAKAEVQAVHREMESKIAELASPQKDDLIRQLKDELAKAQSMAYDTVLEGRLPVLQDSTNLDAEHIICFKEVRPTIYINSLIRWMHSYLRVRYTSMQHKSFLILVIDPLIDQYSVDKYNKHGWAINSTPNGGVNVVITNILDYTKLKKDYDLNRYNLLIVIDRCHLHKNVVSMKRAQTYYFINTINDVADFSLDPTHCIGFFNSGNTNTDVKYHITPWSDDLLADTIDKRSGKITSDAVFNYIFNSIGIGLGIGGK